MAPTDTTDRTTFWQDHVTTWQTSDLTRKTRCEAHDLRHATFGYRVRKLHASSVDRENTSGFVPVALSPADAGLVVALPNGMEIRGIEVDNPGLVRELPGMLA